MASLPSVTGMTELETNFIDGEDIEDIKTHPHDQKVSVPQTITSGRPATKLLLGEYILVLIVRKLEILWYGK